MTKKPIRWLAAGLVAAAAAAQAATDAELLRCRALTDTAARLACYDALPVGRDGAAPAAGASPPASAAPADPAARFGLEQKSARAAIDVIESHIPGRFEGWGPGSRIRLANGQVWRVIDGSRASYWMENPKVKVHRAMFGTFMLEIVGAGNAPRVERVE